MTHTSATTSVRLRRLMPAALFAAAAALGVSTLTDPAFATAERVWDIGVYDACMEEVNRHYYPGSYLHREGEVRCCANSGGIWNEAEGKCGAPPAEGVERPLPPRVAPGAESTAPVEPVTPSTQTFMPGSARQG
jgi:hypothetical protein